MSIHNRTRQDEERHILLVEDNAGDARLFQEYLDPAGGDPFRVAVADTLAAAEDYLAHNTVDVIILDLNLPDSSGLDTLERMREQSVSTPVVVLTGLDDARIGLEAVRKGAQDYLVKGELNSHILLKALHYAEERHRLLRRSEADRKRLAENERRFRTLTQENADGIVVVDKAGVVQFANPAAGAMLGQAAAELPGHPFDFRLSPTNQAEITIRQRDGAIRTVEMRSTGTVWEGEEGYLVSLRDISERKQMEKELQASQERFAKAFHASPSAMAMTSLPSGRIVDANERALNLFGYSREEAIGHTAEELGLWIQSDYRATAERAFADEGIARDLVLQTRTKSGAVRDVLATFERIELENEPVVLTIIEDVTERRRVEEARRQALERLKILHEIDTAILSTESAEQTAARALEKAVALLGLDRGSVALFDFPADSFRFLTVHDRRNLRAEDEEGKSFPLPSFCGDLTTLQAGKTESVRDVAQWTLDEEAHPSPRCPHTMRSFVNAPLSLNGELIGALTLAAATPGAISEEDADVAREVANQLAIALREERLDQQMQRQARQLREIMDAVPEGILLLDDDHHILSANRGARALLTDLIDCDGGERLTHLGATALRPLLKPTEPGAPWRELRLEEGQRILEVGVSTMSLPNRQSGWVLVLRDVTQQREQEQHLQTQDRLAAVGQLAAGIAHDFNNVMAIITLYSEGLLRDGEHPKKEQYLATISEQARHAANLIGQILDFSRHSVMKRQPLNLRPFVKEMVKLFKRTLPENITINLRTSEEETVVEADPTRLQQALMNLVVNARDAMADGGSLDLVLDLVTIEPEDEPPLPGMAGGTWVRLAIADTGTGIAPEVVSHLFEPFFTTKEKGKGTGLGLAQVYGIIKQHEGEIAVTTEVGEGTTFTIYLPVYQAPSPSPEHAAKENRPVKAAGAGETILVVEDNEVVRSAMVAALKEMAFRVIEAADGQEALRLFGERAAAIDLVISDLVMPNVGGAELYERLNEIRPGVTTIMISGYPRDEAGKALLDRGGVFWIQKPFTAKSLAAAVLEALGDRKGEE